MSIQVWSVEDNTAEDHALHLQNLRNQGWERVFTGFTETGLLVSILERGTQDGTVNKASIIENQERRIRRLERLVRQIDSLMQGSVDDEAVPTAWLENQMEMLKTVKTASKQANLYTQLLDEAEAEDLAREGNHA